MGYAEDKTEEELIGLERAITREYRQAYKSVQMKAAKYFGIFEERDKKMREALKDGTYPKLEGASAWMTPEEHYKQWRLAQIGRGKRWEAVRDDLADSITKANEMAANIVNKKTAGIFGFNYNFSAYEIEKKVGKGVAFNIYNEHAVKELLEGKNHTEFRVLHVNRKRDYAWNQKKVQAALTSGILQGQSVPELTDAFLGVMGSNRKAAIRNARTAVTSAQNAGVIESCRKLQEMGIEVLLQWRSAHDGRVRDSHANLDGVRIKPGETFPNGCRYPGDPQGRGSEVYNCRCTLIKILPKYNGDTIESKNTEADYKAWLEGKKAVDKTVLMENNKDKLNKMSYSTRTKEEFTEVAVVAKKLIENYATKSSKWSGNINVYDSLENNVLGLKEWNCDISVVKSADNGVIIHELLHSCSVSYYDKNTYIQNQIIEEASVELLKQEICDKYGILNSKGYPEYVMILRNLNNTLSYDSDMDFAKVLYNIPLEYRYKWLEGEVDKGLRALNASFEDYNEVMVYIQHLKGNING